MSTCPRFSVLTPVYNVHGFLDDCLESVVSQTCGDYELVLVDDGSTDGSGEQCDRFAAGRANVAVVHQENSGLLLARRAAIARARGEYLVTLDSDDRLRPDALEMLSRVIDGNRPDVIAYMYSRAESFKSFSPSSLGIEPGMYGPDRADVFRLMVCRGQHTNNLWTKCVRRDVVDAKKDYSVHRGLTHAEDLLQLLPIADAAESFYYLPEALYYYRPNPGSVTKRYRPQELDDLMVVLPALLSYADKWGGACPEEGRRSALMQCGYLMKILFSDDADRPLRKAEFDRLCTFVHDAGLFGPWSRTMRIDKRLEARALKDGAFARAAILAHLFELVKRARDARAVQ